MGISKLAPQFALLDELEKGCHRTAWGEDRWIWVTLSPGLALPRPLPGPAESFSVLLELSFSFIHFSGGARPCLRSLLFPNHLWVKVGGIAAAFGQKTTGTQEIMAMPAFWEPNSASVRITSFCAISRYCVYRRHCAWCCEAGWKNSLTKVRAKGTEEKWMSHDSICYVRWVFRVVSAESRNWDTKEASQTQGAEQSCAMCRWW